MVSVPSVGSGLVEHVSQRTVRRYCARFSTLCRVGFGGARLARAPRRARQGFSTLCRVGFGGARPPTAETSRPDPFQYPLSGRVWWSFVFVRASRCWCAVSVPSVGSGLVERRRRQRRSRMHKGFQYPLSGRVWWSQTADSGDEPPGSVSVPSVGSGLVEHNSSPAHLRGWAVSVPSVGSGLVELICLQARCLLTTFQYPLSGRVWWSIELIRNPRTKKGFSTLCRVGFGGAVRRRSQRDSQ